MAVAGARAAISPPDHPVAPEKRRGRFRRPGTPVAPALPAIRAPRTVPVLDIPLVEVTYDRVVEHVNAALGGHASQPLTIDAVNTMGLSESCLDARMRDALHDYDMVVPDGMPLVWCMNAKGAALTDRVYGPYLTDRVLAGLNRPTRVAVIGCCDMVHEWLRQVGSSRYPNAEFALLYDAPPGTIDEAYVDNCVELIEASGAELVFVCLGVPRQYYWTALAKRRLSAKVCLSVGGAFDLISGAKTFAPAWMQKAGLTWLHRLAHEPRRLGPRYLKYNSAFLWFLLRREVLPSARRVAA